MHKKNVRKLTGENFQLCLIASTKGIASKGNFFEGGTIPQKFEGR